MVAAKDPFHSSCDSVVTRWSCDPHGKERWRVRERERERERVHAVISFYLPEKKGAVNL